MKHFDQDYYNQYYIDPRTRVCDQKKHAKLVTGTIHLVEWFGVEIESVLDVGAGLGWWGAWIKKNRKGVQVVSTEIDREICRKYKHLQADITMLRLPKAFDLVICQGVLPYLDNVGCAAAIENLSLMCGQMMYLEAITLEDSASSVDVVRTDLSVHLRKSSWYRKHLKPHFVEVGAGLWAKREAQLPFYSLESSGR